MEVAITVWDDRISPVFDASRRLMIASIDRHRVKKTRIEAFDPEEPGNLASRLSALNVTTLICGAVSEVPAVMMEGAGITLIPFVTGNAMEVASAYAQGIPLYPAYAMPGC